MTEFYKRPYQVPQEDSWEGNLGYMRDIEVPQISDVQREQLDQEITRDEVQRAIKVLKLGKTPGTDGISTDFYQFFKDKLQNYLLKLYHEIAQDQIFHLSVRRGIITLIEKQGRDPRELRNWRPISLLNTDLKIFSKIIALRLQQVTSEIIHHSQVGFIQHRYIGENIIKLLNIMEYCENNQKSAILISFDFEKAFDKISWKATYTALEAFNFGVNFVNLVKTLYNQPLSCVINNGFTGEYFELQRSTRQGDPASSLLFAIIVEFLGIKIRLNPHIKGVNLRNYEIKAAQYADDIWTILEPNEQNINNLLQEITELEHFSGLNVSFEKSAAMVIGPLRETDPKYYTTKQLAWTKREINI